MLYEKKPYKLRWWEGLIMSVLLLAAGLPVLYSTASFGDWPTYAANWSVNTLLFAVFAVWISDGDYLLKLGIKLCAVGFISVAAYAWARISYIYKWPGHLENPGDWMFRAITEAVLFILVVMIWHARDVAVTELRAARKRRQLIAEAEPVQEVSDELLPEHTVVSLPALFDKRKR